MVGRILSETISYLTEHDDINAAFDARLIVCHVLGFSQCDLVFKRGDSVSDKNKTDIHAMAERLAGGEPLQYILGTQEFMSLEFDVTPDVLIPRSDTETLVEYLLREMDGRRLKLLDIGTGSGCISISLKHYNENADITAVDISNKALSVAMSNAKKNGTKIHFIHADIMNSIPRGKFDIIVSNPPYIESGVIPTLDRNVKDYEPLSALDGGSDGLDFYRRITNIAPTMLKSSGMLAFEIGYTQGSSVAKLMSTAFCDVCIIKDLCGNDRVVSGRLKSENE